MLSVFEFIQYYSLRFSCELITALYMKLKKRCGGGGGGSGTIGGRSPDAFLGFT